MLEKLRTRGGDVEYGIKFVTAEPQDGCVNVTADRNGERTSFTAFFVVGCDGAHSSVRHGLGLALEGGECHDSFMLADIETNEVLPGDEVHYRSKRTWAARHIPVKRQAAANCGDH